MRLVKSILYYNSSTVEKGNIFSTVMEVIGETDTTLKLRDNNGYEEEINKNFKGVFDIEESSIHLIKVSLYRLLKDEDDIIDVFQKNEKNIKKRALKHVRDTILMYKALYKNIYKIMEKFDIKKVYDPDELAPFGKLGVKKEEV